MNWLERARREIPNTPYRGTAKTAETDVSSVMAVPHRGISRNLNDWNATPDPSIATRVFNDEDMQIIKDGGLVQVWSELLGEWLLWVRGERERRALKAQGCKLPIYTLGELALVVSWPVEDIRRAHRFLES